MKNLRQIKPKIATLLVALSLATVLSSLPAAQAPPSQFDFSLSLSGIIRLAPLGGGAMLESSPEQSSGSVVVGVTLISGNPQSVSLACTGGLPVGGVCLFSQSSGVPDYTSRLTVTTLPGTKSGSYNVAVTGTSDTGLARTIPLTVVVREQGVIIVGGTVIPANILLLLVPYMALALAVTGAVVYLVRSRKTQKIL